MKFYALRNKLVIRITPKASEFLKAYSSNTLEKPRNAFLDIKGKIVAIFDQVSLSEEESLIVIERQFFERLKNHLKTYLFLTGTRLEPLDYLVFHDLDGDLEIQAEEFLIPQAKGKLILTRKHRIADVSQEAYTLFRLKNNLPVQGADYDEESLLNIDDETLVSYTKGCYLGQEIIARVHHRSKPPKKLIVKIKSECRPDEASRMTSTAVDPFSQKELGFLFVDNS